jgi:hypothetical protein
VQKGKESIVMHIDSRPEKGPAVLIGLHFGARGRRARVCAARPVGGAVVAIVLVVCYEDGKGLLARDAGVVGALGGLDCRGDLGGCVVVSHKGVVSKILGLEHL